MPIRTTWEDCLMLGPWVRFSTSRDIRTTHYRGQKGRLIWQTHWAPVFFPVEAVILVLSVGKEKMRYYVYLHQALNTEQVPRAIASPWSPHSKDLTQSSGMTKWLELDTQTLESDTQSHVHISALTTYYMGYFWQVTSPRPASVSSSKTWGW